MVTQNFKRTKFACYAAYFTMSSIFCLPPLITSLGLFIYAIFPILGTILMIVIIGFSI